MVIAQDLARYLEGCISTGMFIVRGGLVTIRGSSLPKVPTLLPEQDLVLLWMAQTAFGKGFTWLQVRPSPSPDFLLSVSMQR
jgi:hypothetical protein